MSDFYSEPCDRSSFIPTEYRKQLVDALAEKYKVTFLHPQGVIVDDFVEDVVFSIIYKEVMSVINQFSKNKQYTLKEPLFADIEDDYWREFKLTQVHTGLNSHFWLSYDKTREKLKKVTSIKTAMEFVRPYVFI